MFDQVFLGDFCGGVKNGQSLPFLDINWTIYRWNDIISEKNLKIEKVDRDR